MYNLVLIEENVLVFASGNLIHFFNVTTKTMTTRRSVGGGGIGCVAVIKIITHLTTLILISNIF